MYSYTAYGLGILSTLPLPELILGNGRVDAVIHCSNVECAKFEIDDRSQDCYVSDEGVYLYWRDVGKFLIRNGNEIVVEPAAKVEENRLRLFILGAAIGVLLYQRGYVVLHASSVVINGGAVLFMARKGGGKSTIAAILHARGHLFISDDVVGLDIRDPRHPLVLPAFPQLKLWPNSVTCLGIDPIMLPQLSAQFEKRSLDASSQFATWPVPLRQIYLLDKGPTISIDPLPFHEATINLIRHLYMARFGDKALKRDERTHFAQCASLARNISVHYLRRPGSFELLHATAQIVEENSQGTIRD